MDAIERYECDKFLGDLQTDLKCYLKNKQIRPVVEELLFEIGVKRARNKLRIVSQSDEAFDHQESAEAAD